jgi:hypothetical protein
MGFRTRARRTGTGRTAPASLGDLATGDAEYPDGLPGPQLAVALQLPVGQMHRLLVVGRDGAWQDPEGRLGVGPAGAEIAQDVLVTVIVTGDRAAPGHVPGNVICQQAAQVRGVVPTGVEGCLGLVEGLEQPRVGIHPALTGAAHAVAAHRPGTAGPEGRLTGPWPAASARKRLTASVSK